ncbi:MAG: Glutamine transport ATP-binding protein GlnQ [Pseudomonadota bacterium]|jgi:ABC-type polar amino acid transport system ATPase subunit
MIVVDGLVKRHGSNEVLKGISLSVAQGEVAAIIGPSGGGKSTFLRCINGLEPFQGGSVRVGSHTLAPGVVAPATLQAVRRQVGFVFQQFNLFPHLSVLDNLLLAPTVALGEARDAVLPRALALLDRVGLANKRDAFPRDLSGGQQQRVAIARTLVMEPACVLFDEPTSALDPVMASEVMRVITDLADSRQTMVVVTHSMHFARTVADHVHVFAGGYDVEHGPPSSVFDAPQHEVTRSFFEKAGKD